MDAYRLLGDDERAAAHARSVIRISTGPNGTEISPMRAAEARLTLGVAAARTSEIEEAIGMGTAALEADRAAPHRPQPRCRRPRASGDDRTVTTVPELSAWEAEIIWVPFGR
ncbi:hypothetical protein [Streptomyces glomeratus]|nr:hypothetical protein [Streptomyces glomeratus]MCF1511699.1 hypothetical protein [Streptomyces glomeratus]